MQNRRSLFLTLLLLIIFTEVNSQGNGAVKCSDAATYSTEGILTTDSDKFPVMQLDEEESLRPGDKGEMHKQFETQLFKSKVAGWMSIGIVEVVSVKGKTVKFKVIEETAEITMNGVKRNQFRKDTRVKFSKYEYGVPVADTLHYIDGKIQACGTMICNVREGQWKEFYPSGKLKANYMCKDGRMHGMYESFFESGKVASKGEYAEDKKTGDWTTYHENEQVASFATYKDGKPMGRYTSWHDNGQQQDEINYSVKGEKEGAVYEWYPNGKLKKKLNLVNGYQEGIQEWYFENGKIEGRIECSRGVELRREVWFANGNRAFVSPRNGNGGLHGLQEQWDSAGKKILQQNYIDGVLAGESKTWYANGNLQDSGYYNSKGKKDGTWMYFYENGKPKELISYSDAALHGPYAAYYENGQVKIRGAYYFKLEDGQWEEFYENGKKKSQGTYLKGKKFKTWYYWDEKGKKRKEKHI